MTARRFVLRRHHDPTGISGTGDVAEGVEFSLTPFERRQGITEAAAAVRWLTDWPTSVVFHDRGVASAQTLHGHGGATELVYLDPPGPSPDPQPLIEVLADPASYMDYEAAVADLHDLVDLARAVVHEAGPGGTLPFHEAVAPLDRFLQTKYPGPTTKGDTSMSDSNPNEPYPAEPNDPDVPTEDGGTESDTGVTLPPIETPVEPAPDGV